MSSGTSRAGWRGGGSRGVSSFWKPGKSQGAAARVGGRSVGPAAPAGQACVRGGLGGGDFSRDRPLLSKQSSRESFGEREDSIS